MTRTKKTQNKNIQQGPVNIYCYKISPYMKVKDKTDSKTNSSYCLGIPAGLMNDTFNVTKFCHYIIFRHYNFAKITKMAQFA